MYTQRRTILRLYVWSLAIGITLMQCKKSDAPSVVSNIEGTWQANGGTGCAVNNKATIINIQNSTGTISFEIPNPYGIVAGDTLYADIKQRNDTLFYSDRATVFYGGGGRGRTRVEIISRNAGKELLVRYPNNDVCNPINYFVKK